MADPKKPGWRTSEGILTAITTLISLAYSLGLLGTGQGVWDKIAGLVVAALATAGYTVTRGQLKQANAATPPPAP